MRWSGGEDIVFEPRPVGCPVEEFDMAARGDGEEIVVPAGPGTAVEEPVAERGGVVRVADDHNVVQVVDPVAVVAGDHVLRANLAGQQADLFIVGRVEDPQALISALGKLAERNLADPEPSRLVELLFYDHPPIAKRIGYLHTASQAAAPGERETPR